jgi:SNF2 family DNA or RNA helicase
MIFYLVILVPKFIAIMSAKQRKVTTRSMSKSNSDPKSKIESVTSPKISLIKPTKISSPQSLVKSVKIVRTQDSRTAVKTASKIVSKTTDTRSVPSQIKTPVVVKRITAPKQGNEKQANKKQATENKQDAKSIKQFAEMGYNTLSTHQKQIICDCEKRKSGGMSVPMGGGKTRIAMVLALKMCQKYVDSKILIVVAKSLIPGWIEEIVTVFGNNFEYEVLHSETVKNSDIWKPSARVIITTPQILSKSYTTHNVGPSFWYHERAAGLGPQKKYYRHPENPYLDHLQGLGYLHSVKWGCVIIDEAKDYQNITSDRCMAAASLSAHHRWLLSGTLFDEPKKKKLFGYYLLLNDHNAPRSYRDFVNYIKDPNYQGLQSTLVHRNKNPDFITPKVKKEIVSHPLTKVEAKIYSNIKNILKTMKAKLDEYKKRGDKINVKKFSSYIVGMIGHLRQCLICPLIPVTSMAIDVADFDQKNELSKIFMDRIGDLKLDKWLADENSIYSSRLNAVNEKLDKHTNERVIVFSCYRKILNVLADYIDEGREVFTITGSQNIEARKRVIEDYRQSKNGVLLLTYDIGANGLNLQCASTVMIMDLPWSSGVIDQSIARLLRQGQLAKIVHIYYFTANTGMENAVINLQISKKEVAEILMVGNWTRDAKIKKITSDEIVKLLTLEDNIRVLREVI